MIKPGSYCCQLLSKDQEDPEEILEVTVKLADDLVNEETRTALRAFLNGKHDVPRLHSSYGAQCN